MALSDIYAVQKAASLPTPKDLLPSVSSYLLERLTQLDEAERTRELIAGASLDGAVSVADPFVLQRLQDHPGGTNSKYFWTEFGRIYPGVSGLARLSGIAAGEKRDEFAFFFEYECGAHCGMGGVAHVKQKGESLLLAQYGIQWVT